MLVGVIITVAVSIIVGTSLFLAMENAIVNSSNYAEVMAVPGMVGLMESIGVVFLAIIILSCVAWLS